MSYGDNNNSRVCRAVIDFIVSLTEAQAFELNAKLTGASIRSVLDGWVSV